MRLIKMLGLAAIAALAAMALVGASSSSAAALKIESCMEGKLPQECKTASIGTKFVASTSTVKLKNAIITNTCSGTLEGKVTDAESAEGAGEADKGEAEITKAAFTGCSFTEAVAENSAQTVCTTGTPSCGWILESWDTLFLPSSTLKVLNAAAGFPKIGCKFGSDATHFVKATWTNAEMSKVALSGSLIRKAGSAFLCGAEGEITGTYEVTSVTDSALPKALNIQILK